MAYVSRRTQLQYLRKFSRRVAKGLAFPRYRLTYGSPVLQERSVPYRRFRRRCNRWRFRPCFSSQVALSHKAPKKEPQDPPQPATTPPPPNSGPGHPVNLWSHLRRSGLVETPQGGGGGAAEHSGKGEETSSHAEIVAGMAGVNLAETPTPAPSPGQDPSTGTSSSPQTGAVGCGHSQPAVGAGARLEGDGPTPGRGSGGGIFDRYGTRGGGAEPAVVGEYVLLATAWPGKVSHIPDIWWMYGLAAWPYIHLLIFESHAFICTSVFLLSVRKGQCGAYGTELFHL